jgi:uncharacterized protein YndB with AHSA1/START domain
MVAVAYEHERGIRQQLQKCDGVFSASGSRTIAAPLAKGYAAWTEEKLRERWLPEAPMEITAERRASQSTTRSWQTGRNARR